MIPLKMHANEEVSLHLEIGIDTDIDTVQGVGGCTGNFSHEQIQRKISHASRIFYPRRLLHDLDLNPRPQAHLPFGCCAARVLKF